MKQITNIFALALTISLIFAARSSLAYNIKPDGVSISGLSSGAYMAAQVQVARSQTFSAAALFSGGPYLCAQGSLNLALEACTETSDETPRAAQLFKLTSALAEQKKIDALTNFSQAKIFLLTGKNDSVVSPQLTKISSQLYSSLGVAKNNLRTVLLPRLGHALPTSNYGNTCEAVRQTPYLSACSYSAAKNALQFIYGGLNRSVTAVKNNFYNFDQRLFAGGQAFHISLADYGVAYVPTSCQNNLSCRLHVALHGCRQTIEDIGDQFYTYAGYNEVAEANNIIILYPQARANFAIGNPRGCWDWWGYTGAEYATKNALQIQMIYSLVKFVSQKEFAK